MFDQRLMRLSAISNFILFATMCPPNLLYYDKLLKVATKLGYKDHRLNEFTVTTNEFSSIFLSKVIALLHKRSWL
jgi:hypothetical protein